ncbi:MAG: NnrU family protein [Devosiaceae bacterium]|nr:NnrU family protein [Devosiaceae bacterium]
MSEFALSIAVFLLAHIIPPSSFVRPKLIALFGRRAYLIAYSILSIALLTWMIVAGQRAPYIGLWPPADWQWWVAIVMMPFSIWLVLDGLFEPNPLSVSLRKKNLNIAPGLSAQVTRHPVLWGFGLWALVHLFPNGDVVSLAMFGGMILLALLGFVVVDRRIKRKLGAEKWQDLARKTSLIPFLALLKGQANLKVLPGSVLWIAVSVLAYVWILISAHAWLLSTDPLAGLGF